MSRLFRYGARPTRSSRTFFLAPTVRNCASICACFPSLHDALGLQRFDILFARSHSAKIPALCWPSFGATVRTRMLPSILTGTWMCGTSPGSGSVAHWTRPRRQTCDPRTSVGNCRPGRTAPRGCLPYLDPMLGRVCHWHGFHCGFVRPTVRQPGCRKGGFAPLLVSQGFGTAHPDWLAGRSDHQIAIRRMHPLVGRVLAVGRALAGRLFVVDAN